MKKKFMLLSLVLVFVFVLAACSKPAQPAQPNEAAAPTEVKDDFPNGRITIVVPFKAGGSLDLMVRSLQPYWEKELGATMVVENYDGAATLVGNTHFINQPADGYTVLGATQPYLSASILSGNATYDIDDFDLLNFQQLDPSCITVPANAPYQTFDELIKYMQDNPGKIRIGTVNGGASHVLIEILKEKYNLDYKFVTYDSGNDYRTALLGGHVDVIASSAQGDVSLGDAVKVLALCGAERLSAWPDSPTFAELGLDDVPALGSGRILAVQPSVKENYPERFEKLITSYEAAFNNPEFQAQLEKNGELDTSSIKGNEASNEMNKGVHETMVQYKDVIIGK